MKAVILLVMQLSLLLVMVATGQKAGARSSLRRTQQQPIANAATASVGQIMQLRLIDTNLDQPVPIELKALPAVTMIDLSSISVTNFSVEAITDLTTNSVVGSVRWDFLGVSRIENSPRWALCGNKGDDFFSCGDKLLANGGGGTIRATPYSGRDGTGVAGASLAIQLVVVKPTKRHAANLTLIDADTDIDLELMLHNNNKNMTVIDLATTPTMNVRADFDRSILSLSSNISGDSIIGSVQFLYDGKKFRMENNAPFAFAGNNGRDYYPFSPTQGKHTITATAHSGRNGQGSLLSEISVEFLVIRTTNAPSAAPTSSSSYYLPELIDIVALSSLSIDVSSGPAVVDLQVIAKSDSYPLSTVAVTVYDSDGSFYTMARVCLYCTPEFNEEEEMELELNEESYELLYENETDDDYWDSNAGKIIHVNISFPFAVSSKTGNYYLEIFLANFELNVTSTFVALELEGRGFPASISVLSQKDLSPPLLVSLAAVSPTKLDMSKGMTSVAMQLDVQDEMTGFNEGHVATFLEGVQTSYAYFHLDVPVAGRSMPFIVDLEFNKFNSQGNHSVEVFLNDASSNNNVTIRSNDLARLGFANSIEIVNSPIDISPPELLSVTTLSPTSIEVSSGPAKVQMKLVVHDTLSGFDIGYIQVTHPDGSFSFVDFGSKFSVEKEEFDVNLLFPRSIPTGEYHLSVHMIDLAGNDIVIDAASSNVTFAAVVDVI